MKKLLLFFYCIAGVMYPAFVFPMEQEQQHCSCKIVDGKYLQICQTCRVNFTSNNLKFDQLKREFHNDILRRQYNFRFKTLLKSANQITELQKVQECKIEESKRVDKSLPSLYQLAEAEVFRQYGRYSLADYSRTYSTLGNLSDFDSMLAAATVLDEVDFPTQSEHLNYLVNRIAQCIMKDDEQVSKNSYIPNSLVKQIGRTSIVELLSSMAHTLKIKKIGSCNCSPMGYGQIAICEQCQPFGRPFASPVVELTPNITLPNRMPIDLIKACISILKEKDRSASEDYLLNLFVQKSETKS